MKTIVLLCIFTLTACGKASNGTDGTNGMDGAQGRQGTPGVNGNTVTTVKFCDGQADHYPNSFPEYGLCIDNNIYAVYWSGSNAFLSKLTPGIYTTTSNNNNCTFTIIQGSCIVQ